MAEFVAFPSSPGKDDANERRELKRLEGTSLMAIDAAEGKLMKEIDRRLAMRRTEIMAKVTAEFEKVVAEHTQRLKRVEKSAGSSTDKQLTKIMATGSLEDQLTAIRKKILEGLNLGE